MPTKTLVLAVAAAAAALTTGAVVWQARDAAGNARRLDAPRSTFTLAKARAFADYPLYDAGPAANGIPRVAVLRRDDGSTDYVSFVYGDCRATEDVGCAPPAEIQVWPACSRNLSLYTGARGDAPRPELSTVRGVPAGLFEGGRRLELQTGTSTVVVFARTRGEVLRIAAGLRGVNVPVRAGERLPVPARGAVEGTLACGT